MLINNDNTELLFLKNFININEINEILDKFVEKELVYKNTEKYSCRTYILNSTDLLFYGHIININEILNILKNNYGVNCIFSPISEYIEMSKGDFLSEHTDGFHDYQAVLYLSNINELEGGEFSINNILYKPCMGDIIIFKGGIKHSVAFIKGGNKRISISFGFNIK